MWLQNRITCVNLFKVLGSKVLRIAKDSLTHSMHFLIILALNNGALEIIDHSRE